MSPELKKILRGPRKLIADNYREIRKKDPAEARRIFLVERERTNAFLSVFV